MGKARLKSRRRQEQGSKLARVFIGILATIGAIDTGSITIQRWGWISSLTCPGGSKGCDIVLNSPWGTVFQLNGHPIPLSLLGFLSYSSILVISIIPFLPWLSKSSLDFSRKAWWGLFLISNCMTTFSFVLMGIMIFKIEEICLFCILSALLSTAILISTIAGGGWEERRDLIFRGIIISTIILLVSLIWSSYVEPDKKVTKPRNEVSLARNEVSAAIVSSKSSASATQLAEHLSKIGAVKYSAYWCPHCHDQRELFGKEASSKLNIIECAEDGKNNQSELCKAKGINGFPSWEINGKIESGVKSLAELAEWSNYKGPRDF